MNIEEFREYCLSKNGVREDFPFDDTTLVFKVGNKMFALTGLEEYPIRFNLKCEPERAVELRELYEGIIPGWHMNKKHWNTVYCDKDVSDEIIYRLIDHSYDLVYNGLTKVLRQEILKKGG